MSGIILDTSVIIAFEKGRLDLDAWFDSLAPDDAAAAIASITVSELLHGVERDASPRAPARKAWLNELIASFSVLDFDEECARVHSELWAGLEKAGRPIGAHDMLIAATALRHDMRVATFNLKDFKRVPHLEVISP